MRPLSRLLLLCALGGLVADSALPVNSWAARRDSAATARKSWRLLGMFQPADRRFLVEAARASAAHLVLGNMAAEKASSSRVREYGRKLVDDHKRVGGGLRQVAERRGLELSDQLTSAQLAQRNRLSRLAGTAFDAAYVSDMLRDHRKMVELYQREADSGSDPDAMSFAARTLPVLRAHLTEVQELAGTRPKAARRK